jgi:uncharacterized OsmC-like protein
MERPMSAAAIKALYERKASAMTRRPAFGRGSAQAHVRLRDGFRCDVEHGERTLLVDQPGSEGGADAGPHPGQLMRASLGACLAMGYRIWGARLGVAIDAVEVELTCDFDARGQLGVADDVAVGWQQVRIAVTITTAAAEGDVRRVVETADRRSPMLANLSGAVRRVHHLTILRPAGVRSDGR